jgi:hypothetical protein
MLFNSLQKCQENDFPPNLHIEGLSSKTSLLFTKKSFLVNLHFKSRKAAFVEDGVEVWYSTCIGIGLFQPPCLEHPLWLTTIQKIYR